MARDILTGTRIRERRNVLGMKQARLAEQAGVSASYLNLIEHNRRRIGGKLLVTIARILELEPSALTEGVEAKVVENLRDAAGLAETAAPEVDRANEFAGRFPGWAAFVTEQHDTIDAQNRTIQALTNRIAHDPQLAAALHEVISTVTAIRSTAGILAEDPDIAPEWRARFHRNINEEAARLSDSSMELVRYLEVEDENGPVSPQDEMNAYLAAVGYRVARLEEAQKDDGSEIEAVIAAAADVRSDAGEEKLRAYLRRYAKDARRLPQDSLSAARAELGDDPAAIAARCDVPLETALHRLALCPDAEAGLMMCDAKGMISFCKNPPHLALPTFGSAVSIWPLFSVLSQPNQPMHRYIVQKAREERFFETFSIAAPVGAPLFDRPQAIEAVMMIREVPAGDVPEGAQVLPLGGL